MPAALLFDPAIFDPAIFDPGIGADGPDSSDIDAALVARLLGDTRLRTLMPDGVFMDEAGASLVTGGNSTRFVIVSLVDEHDEGVFEGRGYEDALYLVKAVALSTSGGNVKAAAARIDAVLENGTLTIPGYTWMAMYREERVRMLEVDAADASIRWAHRGGRYRVQVAPIAA